MQQEFQLARPLVVAFVCYDRRLLLWSNLATEMRLAVAAVLCCAVLWAALGAVTIKRLPLADNLRI